MYTSIVKEAIYYFEQSTAQKFEEDFDKAYDAECRIFELFRHMSEDENICYIRKLIELGYVSAEYYENSNV